jgi:uncharacterized protein YyaL (SSP411 family)
MTEEIYELERAWHLAIRREKDAHDFYEKMARSAEDAATKALFETMAEEELKHKQWLEDEFKRSFQADMEEPRAATGTFVHDLHRGDRPAGFSWWGWEEEAFRLAHDLDVPILLDISASWCHWCHVMDEQTYANAEVAATINADFIPVRVDTDERPDINARYNMGGWPTTAFLTPDGDIITGATFLTAKQFLNTARQVVDYYRSNKGEVAAEGEEPLAEPELGPPSQGGVDLQIVKNVVSGIALTFDKEYGGFGTEPKFPQADALELVLGEYALTGDDRLRAMVEETLQAMASGGLYDHIEGGFFRYSTTRDWSVPHYEKMAEDNARLLDVYLDGYQVFKEEAYRRTAAGVTRYVLDTLADERGWFYASQDADESYYALPAEERAKRKSPYVDKTPYTNYSAMLISALLRAGVVLDDRAPTDAALRAADAVWELHHAADGGMAHVRTPSGEVSGLLADQIWMSQALLDVHECTSDPRYLARAIELMDFVCANFEDKEWGGFFDRVDDPDAKGKLRERVKDIGQNAQTARVALRLHAFTGDEKHRAAAARALNVFSDQYDKYGVMAASYAMAVREFLSQPIQAIIVGSGEDGLTPDLRQAALALYAPYRVIQIVDPRWEPERLARLGYPAEPSPRAYICVGLTCAQPTAKPAEMAGIVEPLVSPWKGRVPRG